MSPPLRSPAVLLLGAWLVLPMLAACGQRAAAPARPPASAPPVEPQRVGVIVTTAEAIPVSDLLARAEREVEQGAFEAARRDFELLLAAAHERELEARIRLGYARALEGVGELEGAVRQLELRLALVEAAGIDGARVELLRRLLLLERFAQGGGVAAQVDRSRVRSEELVLVRAAEALALVERGDAERAEGVLAPAWLVLEDSGTSHSFRTSAAWVSFASAEVSALRARQVVFDPVPDDVAAALEARCRPAMTAQSAYAEAMRLESGTLRLLGGERIARLYLELHRDILAAPLPAGFAGADARALAEGALLLRYEVLLEKAEQMLRITLGGTPDTPAARPARERVAAVLDEVVQKRASQAAKVDGLPVLRSDLVRILESLGAPPTASLPDSSGTR